MAEIQVEPNILNAYNYLPKIFNDRKVMTLCMDVLNALISKEADPFKEIYNAYSDTLNKYRDYTVLTYEAKLEIIHELGFDYLVDLINITTKDSNRDNIVTQLLGFFELIYTLKGKKEGLDVVFKILGLNYEYVTWDETSPKGIPFTAKLKVIFANDSMDDEVITIPYYPPEDTTESTVYKANNLASKIKDFVRVYMLPWIDVDLEFCVNGGSLYLQPIRAIMDGLYEKYREDYSTYPSAARNCLDVALYDVHDYDSPTALYDGIATTLPEETYEQVSFKVICNKEDAVITINEIETNETVVEKFSGVSLMVTYEDQIVNQYIVCNTDREIKVNF